jgi:hypothetical protein
MEGSCWVRTHCRGKSVHAGRASGARSPFGSSSVLVVRATKASVPAHRVAIPDVPGQRAILAGGLGFEPRNGSPRQRFSRPSPSSARPPSQVGAYREIDRRRATLMTVDSCPERRRQGARGPGGCETGSVSSGEVAGLIEGAKRLPDHRSVTIAIPPAQDRHI